MKASENAVKQQRRRTARALASILAQPLIWRLKVKLQVLVGGGYRCVNRGARFSTNAVIPSF